MKKKLKLLILYIKYHKEINELYNFSLKGKNGEQVPEDCDWEDRTRYWYWN
jgi:hypothetical protein